MGEVSHRLQAIGGHKVTRLVIDPGVEDPVRHKTHAMHRVASARWDRDAPLPISSRLLVREADVRRFKSEPGRRRIEIEIGQGPFMAHAEIEQDPARPTDPCDSRDSRSRPSQRRCQGDTRAPRPVVEVRAEGS